MSLDDFVSTNDAAKILDAHPDWIRKLCRREVIECQKFGNVWMVSKKSLEAYAATERKTGPKPKQETEETAGETAD